MKTLFLLRHAKSDWPEDTEDFYRPLTESGNQDASKMVGFCLEFANQHQIVPQKIISSPALRTLQTAQYFADVFKLEIDEEPTLYNPSEINFSTCLENLSDEITSVLLVSHNNGISNFANTLSAEILHFKTCALAIFQFPDVSWAEAIHSNSRLLHYQEPTKN